MAFQWMCLDQGQLTFEYGGGKPYCCDASTGRPGVMNPTIKDQGPIPPGHYYIDPHSWTYSHVEGQEYEYRQQEGDWGHYRVAIFPYSYTELHGRNEFYLHGGKAVGSAGCIDVGPKDVELFPIIEKTNANDGMDDILLIVTNTPNAAGWENM